MEKLTLESSRLIYKQISNDSLGMLHEIFRDEKLTKYFVTGPDKNKKETLQRLEKIISHWKEYNFGDFIILNRETLDLVGFGGLHYKIKDGNINISYIVKDNYQRKGIGFEIAKTLLDYGYIQLNFEEIFAEIDPENSLSKILIEKCGFKKRGILEYQGYRREEYILRSFEYQRLYSHNYFNKNKAEKLK